MKVSTVEKTNLPDVQLTLTAEEATVLGALLGKVSGDFTSSSPRKFLSPLYKWLHDNGYDGLRRLSGPHTFIWRERRFKFVNNVEVTKLYD